MVIKEIKTELWIELIKSSVNDGWRIVHEYDNFDKGIDHDFFILTKGSEMMFFAWDNWFEGEIKCTEERQRELEKQVNVTFKVGDPLYLKPDVIAHKLEEMKKA
ncbi:MAG: hypothetical protein KF843_04880 [Flavobacteriales bacterium]|nr:hypothetical protein [Flavobacteriales bacterium]